MNRYTSKPYLHNQSNPITEQSNSKYIAQSSVPTHSSFLPTSSNSLLHIQRTIGNQYVQRVIQRQSGLTHLANNNNNILKSDVIKDIDAYVDLLSNAVDEASQLIETRSFIHVSPIDGYMRALFENFDQTQLRFTDAKTISRQAGYWIESYVTKVLNFAAPTGMHVVLQAKRGNTRPDIILIDSETKQDVAWLDITSNSSHSINHIFSKDGAWDQVPYAREILYQPISNANAKITQLPAKDQKLVNLSADLEKQKKEYALKEANFIIKFGEILTQRLENDFYLLRKQEQDLLDRLEDEENIEHSIYDSKKITSVGEKRAFEETSPITSDTNSREFGIIFANGEKSNVNPKKKIKIQDEEDVDRIFNRENPDNQYALQTRIYFRELTNRDDITTSQIASFVLAWNSMNARAINNELIKTSYLLSKNHLGLSKEPSSGSEGLIFIEEWFPEYFKNPPL